MIRYYILCCIKNISISHPIDIPSISFWRRGLLLIESTWSVDHRSALQAKSKITTDAIKTTTTVELRCFALIHPCLELG